MMAAFAFLIMIVVMMAAFTFLIMIMVMMLVMLLLQRFHRSMQGILMLHRFKDSLTVKKLPRRCYDRCRLIVLAKKCNCIGDLLIRDAARVRKNDGSCIADLIDIKLAKILGIHLAFICIGNRAEAIQHNGFRQNRGNGTHHVRKLTNAGGLDQNTVGMILLQNLRESLGKITNKRATDAARIHFRDVNARFAEKAAVDSDLTKFVFDQNDLLARISLLQ